MQYNFDVIYDRRNTSCLKWDCAEKIFNDTGVLPMWIADMDFQAPPYVIDAIKGRCEHGIFGYSDSLSQSYCSAIINWVAKRHGWSVKSEWLSYTPGVVSALSIAVMEFTMPGDKVIIQSPVYPPFFTVVRNNGRQVVNNPLRLIDGHYTMDFDDLERKMKSGIKMMILCSPHNPVGRVWSREELACLAELCLKNNVLLVSDEIHSDIVFSNYRHIPIASISDKMRNNTITCIAASKTFGIAGLTTSAAIISNPELRERFRNRVQSMGIEMGNTFGLVATEAAYRYGEEWLEQLLVYLQGNLRFLEDYFRRKIPEIEVIKPEGTYLVWLDCNRLGLDADELSALMVHMAKIGLNNGATFGAGGDGFLRMNIACPRSILAEGLRRIERAVAIINSCRLLSK